MLQKEDIQLFKGGKKMIKEVKDYYDVLEYVHESIDQLLNELSAEQWVKKEKGFNNIASIIDHITAVENGFMKVLSGEKIEKMPAESFKEVNWNIENIKAKWSKALSFSEEVLKNIGKNELDELVDLGVGMDVNKRQLIILTISHLTHHRGQIPLILRAINASE
jgi:uncharacterized damage-inducible protein DinB